VVFSLLLILLSEPIYLGARAVMGNIHRHRMRLARLIEPDAALGFQVQRHELPSRGGLDKENRRGTGFAFLGLDRGGGRLGHLNRIAPRTDVVMNKTPTSIRAVTDQSSMRANMITPHISPSVQPSI